MMHYFLLVSVANTRYHHKMHCNILSNEKVREKIILKIFYLNLGSVE